MYALSNIFSIAICVFFVISGHAGAITGSWYFTGCRFDGRVAAPQILRTDGTAVITMAPSGNYTIAFQFGTSTTTLTVPLVRSGLDYRASLELDVPPYNVKRSVVIRDHGNQTLTMNWVDAGFSQNPPYAEISDMESFLALSGALTKLPAPPADSNTWVALYEYNGHLLETGFAQEFREENFSERYQIVRTSPSSLVSRDVSNGEETVLDDLGGYLEWMDSQVAFNTYFEDQSILLENTGGMEESRLIQLGSGRVLLVWFGQQNRQLTVKPSLIGPGSGPHPALKYAYAEAGILLDTSVSPGPAVPADLALDTDGDGVTDFLEYAFNLNATIPDRRLLGEGVGVSGLPSIRRSEAGPLRVEYVQRKNANLLGISYEVQWSSDLTSWSTGEIVTQTFPIDSEWERVIATDPGSGSRRFARVVVAKTGADATNSGMVLIPSGSFTMGRTSGDIDPDAPPVTITVGEFQIGKYEVTKALWDEVRTWAVLNGYSDLAVGSGKGADHPVHTVSWWDVVKWCNARSQKEGLSPVYTVSGAVMKTGSSNPVANWSANGYRLPTEAEWEKAARGGAAGKRYPWGSDTITHALANYASDSTLAYDISPTRGFHPDAFVLTTTKPHTLPVGSLPGNGFGLHEMAGNLYEWCWDWYASNTYINGANNPRGPASGSGRVFRGGGWQYDASDSRCAQRYGNPPGGADQDIGFRVVRGSGVGEAVAPEITMQPAPVTIDSGSTTTLTLTATGSAPLTYQWYQGAVGTTTTPVGTNSGSFTTPALTATTTYWVRVSNSAGNVNSALATVTVNPPVVAPSITAHPVSTAITSGQTATLTVAATGSVPLTYQWYQGAVGTTTTPVGTNSASFTTPALTATTTYWVRVSNAAGNVNSSLATVSMAEAPAISTQPASSVIVSGQTATLSVVATGTAPLTYQWYQGAIGTTTTPVGTNSASFTTPALSASTSYWVRVSNAAGSVNSSLATVSMAVAPAISTQPASSVIVSGQTATLSVVATGTAPLTYQWYQGAVGTTTTPVGTNSASFTTPALTVSTSYWVRVSNAAGSVNSSLATVSMAVAPAISTQPASSVIVSGQTATLSVVATGTAPLTYQWYQGAVGTTTTPVGTNSASFTTPALTATTTYWVRVSNTAGNVNSALATVTVNSPVVAPSITAQPVSTGIISGQTATLTVTSTGSAPLTYQWYQGAVGTTTTPVGTNSASFTTPALTATTPYWVRVSNSAGSVNSTQVYVTVNPPTGYPSITTQPTSVTVNYGGSATLTVAANGNAPLGYVWYQGLVGDTRTLVGMNSTSFNTGALTSTTNYWVRVSNSLGDVNSTLATVTVNPPAVAPAITTQPASLVITSGQSATLNVVATGTAPLSYQWYRGAVGTTTNPVGTNSASFATPALTATTTYWVRVSNSAGNVNSLLATVTVATPPAITTQPQSVAINAGSTTTLSVVASGTAPLTYQWYQGAVGTTTTPVGTNSASFTTPALAATTTYWVRVSNQAGSMNSGLATVTVTTPPAISTQPASSVIVSGQTATLSVVATGTAPLTYQWYQGAVGTTTTPVGTNSASFTTPALTVSTSYWVRVSNVAGSVNSSLATVSMAVAPAISTQPASSVIVSGQTVTLSVVATGTALLTYQWYQGAVGTTTTPVGTNSASFTTPALTVSTSYWVRVSNAAGSVNSTLATVTVGTTTPADLALIPAGSFTMGRTSGDTDTDAPPVTVTVSSFYMGKNEVTKALWDEVRTWALANGYTDLANGAGKAANHPVQTVSWWDVVKWCNARSQKEGLTPCYTVSGAVMKIGSTTPTVHWSANGYRLPTEAEWEKAARGGVNGKRFPWGTDTIRHSQANYYADSSYGYDISGLEGGNFHPDYSSGSDPMTAPVSSFSPNGYGLHEMTGNVREWCWDWYGSSTYVNGTIDPRGAASGMSRVYRGGCWISDAPSCRVAYRGYYGGSPTSSYNNIGFRFVRSSVP